MTKQGSLPLQIDPYRLAETGRAFSGFLSLKHMHRLRPSLLSDSGKVRLELQFDIDETGTRILRGHLITDLELECQRCLTAVTFSINKEMCIAFVRSNYEAEQLPEEYDPCVVEQTPIALIDLIEDELILSLPQVPMHKREDCPASKLLVAEDATKATDELEQKENPFEILAKLKDSE
jgi:uncharacterized protein